MAAPVGASRPDYNSDEEVYNTARAVDEASGLVFDADGNQVIAGEADSRKVRLRFAAAGAACWICCLNQARAAHVGSLGACRLSRCRL